MEERALLPIEAQFILDDQSRWIGGRLVNYYSMSTQPLLRDETGNTIPDPEFPRSTVVTLIQFLEGYFEVIGESFACNGKAGQLRTTTNPKFKPETQDTVVFWGAKGHEWHVVPLEA